MLHSRGEPEAGLDDEPDGQVMALHHLSRSGQGWHCVWDGADGVHAGDRLADGLEGDGRQGRGASNL